MASNSNTQGNKISGKLDCPTNSYFKASSDVDIQQKLKKKKLTINEHIERNRQAYSNAHSYSKKISASLCTVPYDEKTIPDLSLEARETLHRFISRVICLYIYSLSWLHHNRQFKANLLVWAKKCLILLAQNLNLEDGDFLTESLIILENLKSDFRSMENKNILENNTITNNLTLTAPDTVTALSSLTSDSFCFATNELEMQTIENIQCSYFHEVLNLQPIKSLLNSKGLLAALQIAVNEAFDHKQAQNKFLHLSTYETPVYNHSQTRAGFFNIPENKSFDYFSEGSEDEPSSSQYDFKMCSTVDKPLLETQTSHTRDLMRCIENISNNAASLKDASHTDFFKYLSSPYYTDDICNNVELTPPSALALTLRNLFINCILNKNVDARLFVIFMRTASALDIPSEALFQAAQEEIARQLNITQKEIEQDTKESFYSKNVRRLKVASVATGLGALTALTVGLAAPAIAAGLGAFGIAGMSGAAFMGTAGGSATLASLFGAGTAGFSGWKYSRRVQKIKVFYFDKIHVIYGAKKIRHYAGRRLKKKSPHICNDKKVVYKEDSSGLINTKTVLFNVPETVNKIFFDSRIYVIIPNLPPALSVIICISGWLREQQDVWKPWRCLCSSQAELYALRWDPSILLDLGTIMLNLLSQSFAVTATNLWLQTTIASALSTALIWPITLIQYASQLDNTWMVCREKATQAGKLLAAAITDEKNVGCRPVTLIGFSMGARVIHACLQELHRENILHRVHSAILIGCPVSCNKESWLKAREVVSDRLINVYCSSDWLLGFLFRYMEWGISVAGLSCVKVPGVENYNVSEIVTNHGQYADKIGDILAYINVYSQPDSHCSTYLGGKEKISVSSNVGYRENKIVSQIKKTI